jgi:hypothetical protein
LLANSTAHAQKSKFDLGFIGGFFTTGDSKLFGGHVGYRFAPTKYFSLGPAIEATRMTKEKAFVYPLFLDIRVPLSSVFSLTIQPGYNIYSKNRIINNGPFRIEEESKGGFYLGAGFTGYMPTGIMPLYVQLKINGYSFQTSAKAYSSSMFPETAERKYKSSALSLGIGVSL